MRVDIEVDKFVSVAGGQWADESGSVDEYWVQFEGLDLSMGSAVLKKFAVKALNHLMVNGHKFEFGFTDVGQKEITGCHQER